MNDDGLGPYIPDIQALQDLLPGGRGASGAVQISRPDYGHLLNADELRTLGEYNANVQQPFNKAYFDNFNERADHIRRRNQLIRDSNDRLRGLRGPSVMAVLHNRQQELAGGGAVSEGRGMRFIGAEMPVPEFDPSKALAPRTAGQEYPNISMSASQAFRYPPSSGSRPKEPPIVPYNTLDQNGKEVEYGGSYTTATTDHIKKHGIDGLRSGTQANILRTHGQQLFAPGNRPFTAKIATKRSTVAIPVQHPIEAAYLQFEAQAVDNWPKVGGKFAHPKLYMLYDPAKGKFGLDPKFMKLPPEAQASVLENIKNEVINAIERDDRSGFVSNNFSSIQPLLRPKNNEGKLYNTEQQLPFLLNYIGDVFLSTLLGTAGVESAANLDFTRMKQYRNSLYQGAK